MTETVKLTRSGAVARIVLDNPGRHNSLGADELNQLRSHLQTVADDEGVRTLIVTGTGESTFCAGASLNQLGAGHISGDLFQETTDALASVRMPTICALNGSVYGGGVELALACDFRVGVQGSVMRVPAARIGLCYPISGINRFVECLGVATAKRILLAAEEFNAEGMLGIGFLDELVEGATLETRCFALAESIAGLAPLAVQAMKKVIAQAAARSVDVEEAQALARRCATSDDLQEGFAAQREKRAPRFVGS